MRCHVRQKLRLNCFAEASWMVHVSSSRIICLKRRYDSFRLPWRKLPRQHRLLKNRCRQHSSRRRQDHLRSIRLTLFPLCLKRLRNDPSWTPSMLHFTRSKHIISSYAFPFFLIDDNCIVIGTLYCSGRHHPFIDHESVRSFKRNLKSIDLSIFCIRNLLNWIIIY